MTGEGSMAGTADYMAPEQAVDVHSVTIAADLYSLGCTLYCLLAGRPPFDDDRHPNLFRKLVAHREEPAPTLVSLRPGLPMPPALPPLVDRLLAKDPADRPSEPRIVAEALAELARGHDLPRLFGRPAVVRSKASPEVAAPPESGGKGAESPVSSHPRRGGQPDVERSPGSAPPDLPRRQGDGLVVRHDHRPALDRGSGVPPIRKWMYPPEPVHLEGPNPPIVQPDPSAPPAPQDPKAPQPVKSLIRLLPGRKLDNFTKFITNPDRGKAPAPDDDPDGVFTSDQPGQLHISGKHPGSILVTNLPYKDYVLNLEYRYGSKVYNDPTKIVPRRSGVRLHLAGPLRPALMNKGFHVTVFPNDGGSIILREMSELSLATAVDHFEEPTAKTPIKIKSYYHKPGSTNTTVRSGIVHQVGVTMPRPPGSGLRLDGGWERLQCICEGDRLRTVHDGNPAVEATKLSVAGGRIAFVSDGAEVFFRNIVLKPLE